MSIVSGVTIPVSNLARALDFYRHVLDFELQSPPALLAEARCRQLELPDAQILSASLQLGREQVELQQFVTPAGRAAPAYIVLAGITTSSNGLTYCVVIKSNLPR